MTTKKQISKVSENPVNRGRHEHQCRICSHPKRDEIEGSYGRSENDKTKEGNPCRLSGLKRQLSDA
jgi:hypothetical protein